MSDLFYTERIDIDGFEFLVEYYYDPDTGPPWDQCDGHGPVRMAEQRYARNVSKRPGERPLRGIRDTYLYDWQAAAKLARKDKWGPGGVHEAVQEDFEYLRTWLQEDWWYCGVEVKLALQPQYNDSLWGVESYKDYHLTSAKEQARELLRQYLNDIERGALRKE